MCRLVLSAFDMFVWLQIFASFRNFLSVAVLKERERERESQREKERERERESKSKRERVFCKKSKKSSQKIVLRRSNPAKTARLYSTTFSSNRIAPTQGASWADNNLLSMKNCTLSVFFYSLVLVVLFGDTLAETPAGRQIQFCPITSKQHQEYQEFPGSFLPMYSPGLLL